MNKDREQVVKYFEHLKQMNVKDPKNVDVLIQLGALEFEYFHRHNAAIEYFNQAIQYEPNNVDARFWLATCFYHDFCDYEQAEEVLLEALKRDPQRADCLSLMASIIRWTDRPLLKAIECVKQAMKFAPDWLVLRIQLIELLLEADHVKEAEVEAKKTIEFLPKTPKPIRNEVERYYETIITGRAWTDGKEKIDELFQKIENVKKLRTK